MLNTKQEIISGIPTDIFSYESNSNLHILIFPGNPGIGAFYLEFAKFLIQKTNSKVNLYIISYAGFTKEKPQKNYSLQEELDHKINVINHLKSNWKKKSRVVFIGHSIGAWLAKELTKVFRKELKPTTFLLFPFLAKSNSKQQSGFAQFVANEKYIRLLLGSYRIFRKLPSSIILSITKLLYSHASETAIEIIQEYFLSKNHIVESVFYLGNTEFQTLTEDLDLGFFQSNVKSTILFYCADDVWAPTSQLDFLKSNIPSIQSEFLPLITHDFCVNHDQCEIVASKVMEYLRT